MRLRGLGMQRGSEQASKLDTKTKDRRAVIASKFVERGAGYAIENQVIGPMV